MKSHFFPDSNLNIAFSNVKHIWKRNFLFYKKNWEISFFWTMIEPLITLFAIGFGLGSFVNQINDVPYIDFLFPAMLCNTAMIIPYFEATYSNYSKLKYQKLYSALLLSPMNASELIIGELVWATTKGFFAILGIAFVASFWSLINFQQFLALLPLLLITSWIFSCVGMASTAFAKNYDWFVYISSGLIIPLSLFSGTYFPLDNLPSAFNAFVHIFPLAHSVSLARSIMSFEFTLWSLFSLAFLLLAAVLFTRFTIKNFLTRLLKT
ncbi:MAG TPA: ABC transporter permease [Pseudobdellovibrionaceae bacterium]|nr:ABC transporter permease [Pseudobdellovibrionaceae bacterium]